MNGQKKQTVIDDSLITYYKYEGNQSPSIVLLHGWRSSSASWQPIIELLRSKNSIIAIDLPGFGESSSPKKPLSVGDFSNIVSAVIKKEELKNVVLVGHSLGGRIAIKLSAMSPDLINRLVLVDSAGFATKNIKSKAYNKISKVLKPFFKPKAMQPV